MNKIRSFKDFVEVLRTSGFSMGGGSKDNIYSVVSWSWNEIPPYKTPVRWHTGDQETDPWEWRMRVLSECDDIAYGKLFFNKSGYITKEWYPYFLAARRNGKDFYDAYADGTISHAAKQIYELLEGKDMAALHMIKQEGGFAKEDKSVFDRAVTELQMKLYITMCGNMRKLSMKGKEYSWPSTTFCTVERFWEKSIFDEASGITREEAIAKITERVYELNPDANGKKIKKFIGV